MLKPMLQLSCIILTPLLSLQILCRHPYPPTQTSLTVNGCVKSNIGFGIMKNTEHALRIVALGCQQRKGVNYFERFSPTVSQTTICLLLALTLTALLGFRTEDYDVTCAFISAVLDEQVYMRPVPGFPLPEGKV